MRWDLLADAARGPLVWKALARQMGPQALRMNLNTLARHEVFDGCATMIGVRCQPHCRRRRDPPLAAVPVPVPGGVPERGSDVPQKIKAALHRAAEIACGNVPELPGPVVIGLDVSGSMRMPVTGHRGRGATSKMRCVDVAALFAAAILRRNPDSVVVPFDTRAYGARLDPQDTILSLAERLASYGGGGTDCSLPLREANTSYRKRRFAGWCWSATPRAGSTATSLRRGRNGSTGVMTEWQQFVKNQLRLRRPRHAGPKLVCIDLQPYTTTPGAGARRHPEHRRLQRRRVQRRGLVPCGDAGRFVAEVEAVEL